jgi:hypothetical protein
MNLIYIYSLNFTLLGSFYASNGYGINQVGAGEFVKPRTLPEFVLQERLPNGYKTSCIMKQNKVIVKRMD